MLQGMGHSDLDYLMMTWGVDSLNAARALGGRQARVTALAKFAIDNPTALTAEGEPFWGAIVRRAAEMDPHYPDGLVGYGITNEQREKFWAALKADGYQNAEGKIVRIASGASDIQTLAGGPPMEIAQPRSSVMDIPPNNRKVFLVHGRDQVASAEVVEIPILIGV
jgi:hypothetical protein